MPRGESQKSLEDQDADIKTMKMTWNQLERTEMPGDPMLMAYTPVGLVSVSK